MILALVTVVNAGLGCLLLGFAGVETPLRPLMIQAATTTATYPLVVLFCARLQRRWLR